MKIKFYRRKLTVNTFKNIKEKYNLKTNLKGIEYIEALEKEVQSLNIENEWLYGKLNIIHDVLEEGRKEVVNND
jgi:hypothetical protein